LECVYYHVECERVCAARSNKYAARPRPEL
jgi:hypothetical protein